MRDSAPIAELPPRALATAIGASLLLHAALAVTAAVWIAFRPAPAVEAGASALTIRLSAFSEGPKQETPAEVETEPEPEKPVVEKIPKPVARAAPAKPVAEPEAADKAAPETSASETAGTGGMAKTGAAAAGIGAVTMEADYLASVGDWLARHKKYPSAARRRGIEGTGTLRFRVARDGRVLWHRLDESAGSAILDREIEAMIERASPLPPFPPELEGDDLELTIPVRFQLER